MYLIVCSRSRLISPDHHTADDGAVMLMRTSYSAATNMCNAEVFVTLVDPAGVVQQRSVHAGADYY
jgi:hypothetical protein